MGEAEACGDRIFSVATGLAQGWLLGCRKLGSSIVTEACPAARSACETERSCARDRRTAHAMRARLGAGRAHSAHDPNLRQSTVLCTI